MKHSSVLSPRQLCRELLTGLCSLTLAGPLLAADPASDRQSEAYRASVAQDTLKNDISAVKSDLAELRDEMRQLLPEDVKLVDRAFQQLDSLSRNEMDQAVSQLRDASRSGDLQAQLGKLAGAFKDQSAIGTSLKRMAVDLNARQSLAGIGPKLAELVMRQTATANELARLGGVEQVPEKLRDHSRRRYDVASSDQDGVTDDIKILVKQIDDLAQNLSDESQKTMMAVSALAKDQKLTEAADSAVKLTHEGPFNQAVTVQRAAVKTLVMMEQALSPDMKTEDRLRGVSEKLDKLITEQKQVTDQILQIGIKKSVPDEVKNIQAMLNDQVAALRAEVDVLNTRASRELGGSEDSMTKAMANYDRMWEERDMARENSQAAVTQLEAAKQALDQQMAALPTLETPQQLAGALEALKRDTAQAAAQQKNAAQAAAAANPATPGAPQTPMAAAAPMTPEQQQALRDKVESLQQQALPISPDAAKELAQAAEQMANPDAASQQAAAQSLAQAAQDVAQQEAALTGQTPAQQALARAENQVAQVAQATQQAQANLQSSQTSPQATNQLDAARQQALAAEKAAAAAGAPPEATQALAQAAQALGKAQMDAAQVKLPQAQADAKGAQQALAQAQQAMAQASQAMAQQAGAALAGNKPPSPDGPPNQNAGNIGGGPSGDNLTGAGAQPTTSAEVVTGLEPHDRDAITQLQAEKVPDEFVSQVRQYYKNLADGAGF